MKDYFIQLDNKLLANYFKYTGQHSNYYRICLVSQLEAEFKDFDYE